MAVRTFGTVPLAVASGTATNDKDLQVPMVLQGKYRYWCVSACIAMLARYFGRGSVKACDVASKFLNRQDACSSDYISACDVAQPTFRVSTVMETFYRISNLEKRGPLNEEKLVQELDNDRPVMAAFINDATGGGHVVVLRGYSQAGGSAPQYLVNDPLAHVTKASYNMLCSTLDWGPWERSWYFMRRT
jgi:hypothetical protein